MFENQTSKKIMRKSKTNLGYLGLIHQIDLSFFLYILLRSQLRLLFTLSAVLCFVCHSELVIAGESGSLLPTWSKNIKCFVSDCEVSSADTLPIWAKLLRKPPANGYSYFVGVSSDSVTKEDAWQRARANAFERAATQNFPFLLQMRQSSLESLEKVEFRRESQFSMDKISWQDIEEDQVAGSPVIVPVTNKDGQRYTVYVLMKWKQSAIEKERIRLKKELEAGELPQPMNEYPTQGLQGIANGKLTINTVPPGATFKLIPEFPGIDPAKWPEGKSNAIFSQIPQGMWQLQIQRDGYEPVTEKIKVLPDFPTVREFTLKKLTGIVDISSNPSGADVFIGNQKVGKTPYKAVRDQGEADIRIELQDYFPQSRTVEFRDRQSQESFVLKPKDGILSILSTPAGATVLIDDRELGKTPFNKRVEGGTRNVTLKLPGYEPFSETVSIKDSTPIVRNLKLKPEPEEQSGNIVLSSFPSGAKVYVNSIYRGTTPLTLQVEVGSYDIFLELDGFSSYSKRVFISNNQDNYINGTLYRIQNESRSDFSSENYSAQSPTILSAGKLITGVTGVLFWLKADEENANAQEAYKSYTSAKTASEASSARKKTDAYDSSQASYRTISLLSLASFGLLFVIEKKFDLVSNNFQHSEIIHRQTAEHDQVACDPKLIVCIGERMRREESRNAFSSLQAPQKKLSFDFGISPQNNRAALILSLSYGGG